MNEEEFIEAVLFPAFNDNGDIALVDEAFGNPSGEGTQVLNITMNDGDNFQVTIVALMVTMGSDDDRHRELVSKHGRCVCTIAVCDEDACGYCAHIDPEWPCPHDPETPKDVRAGWRLE